MNDRLLCISCNRALQKGIYDSAFYPNLLSMLSAFIVLAIIVAFFSALAAKRYAKRSRENPDLVHPTPVPLVSAAAVLGIGLGGFIDGIVFHQVFQLHGMLSAKIPPATLLNKSINMFWDGVFHLFTWIVTLIGIILMWRLLKLTFINRSGYLLSGGLISGWGIFNLVEGAIDHQVLKLHNVNEYTTGTEMWNYGFLLFGVLLILGGYALYRLAVSAEHAYIGEK